MAEENDNILDLEGAQDYLNNLLENQTAETPKEEEAETDEKFTKREAELLKDAANIEDAEEELDPKQIQNLIDFVGGDWKDMNPEELSDEDLERLTKITVAKAAHFNYRPKKHYGIEYKKKRQRRNKMAKKSRQMNRA